MTARRSAAIAAFILAVAAGPARSGPNWGVEAQGSWNRLAMGGVNDSLASLNAQLGAGFESIHQGLSWGLAFRAWSVRENVLVRIAYERLAADVEDSGIEFGVGAHAVMLGVTWWMPAAGRVRYGIGGALGPHWAAGHMRFDDGSFDASGEGFGGFVQGEAMVPMGRGWSLVSAAGYRLAKIDHLKFDERVSDLTADYSGPWLRLGVAIDSRPLAAPPTTP